LARCRLGFSRGCCPPSSSVYSVHRRVAGVPWSRRDPRRPPLEPLSRSLASASVSLSDQFGCRTGWGTVGRASAGRRRPPPLPPSPSPGVYESRSRGDRGALPLRVLPFSFLPETGASAPLNFYLFFFFFLFFSFVLDNYFVTSSLIRAYPLEPLSAWLTVVRTFGRSGFALSILPLMVKKLQQLKILEHMVLAVCKYVYMYCPIIILNSSKLRIILLNKNST